LLQEQSLVLLFFLDFLLRVLHELSQLFNERVFINIVFNSTIMSIALARFCHFVVNVRAVFHCLAPDILPIRVSREAIREISNDNKKMDASNGSTPH